ncbi:MAG: hypothetical protein MUE67_01435 [Anaerolineales bacterium]|jgi:hypothetical protein|nr:hypothetical protein [Anaerolineales bacterium]
MNGRFILTLVGVLIIFMPTGCGGKIAPSTIATSSPSQPVTQIVQKPAATKTVAPELSDTFQVDSSTVLLEPDYFDGVMVLTRYYTLLEHGLYKEVLPLYSSSLLKNYGGKNIEVDLKSVKLKGIQPYSYWLAQTGQSPQKIPENEIRFIVYITWFHNAPAWNLEGTPQPDEQTRFISLIRENGEWKLYELQSSPWFQ